MTIVTACQHQTFVNNVRKMARANGHLSLKQLGLAFSLSHSTVWVMARKYLGCCKLWSKWVPKYYVSVWQRILTEWPCHWPTCHFPKLKLMTHIVLHIVTCKDTRLFWWWQCNSWYGSIRHHLGSSRELWKQGRLWEQTLGHSCWFHAA